MTQFDNREPASSGTSTPGGDARPTADPPAGVSIPAHSYTPPEQGDPLWIILGSQGLRAGWSILLFAALLYLFADIFGTLMSALLVGGLHLEQGEQTAGFSIAGECGWVMALALALAIVARIERRRLLDYYLAGPAAITCLLSGVLSGFAALTIQIAVMAWGGWIRFGAAPHYGSQLVRHALLWAIAFLLVALTEEGSFRCFLQFTLARSLNFGWAAAAVAGLCLWLTHSKAHGAGGVYAMALLGLFPCLFLEWKKSPQRGFWQAAWVGSTGFGFIHTGNNGETWIGILAAGAIGFVFCVSVKLTGSAWWAIGCHAAWDWAESYFYGTADSGFVASGHLFTTVPAGSALWSGGTDGPEGSILVLPVVLILMLVLFVLYGRKRQPMAPAALAENSVS